MYSDNYEKVENVFKKYIDKMEKKDKKYDRNTA
jgi:hypothetical protein